MSEVKTIRELKQIIVDNGMTIEPTSLKGRYKITSKDGIIWKTVRFQNAKPCSYATVNVLHYDFEGREEWFPFYIDGFIEEMTL